ncbi:MAG TPA: quinolinate synthase NadA [Anaerolineae bacterium]|nr:quinolinate synthase NadA [Anaerolineae bacterium]HQI87230.1 quinolinate synthase NadA [Anaerolineae bacterium]
MDDKTLQTLLDAAAPLIELAVAEDIGPGDATSTSTLDPRVPLHGRITAKERGVIAGLPVVEAVFRRVDPAIVFTPRVADGQEVVPGEVVADVVGPGPSLLAAERIALNFLQRMSGIATVTRSFVAAVSTTNATILDTRKTLPGYRMLDKYAVRMGGGMNHRMSLFDMLMVKDNHVDGAGGLLLAVERARAQHPDLPIEVEVRDLDELRQALAIEPPLDRILLDNMDLDTMREAVAIAAGRVPLEASGNVTRARLKDIAETGVDFISAGALTHSVKALDLSMKIQPVDQAAKTDPATRVREAKAALGDGSPEFTAGRLVILGHHYQREDVIAFADYRGDSLELARRAARTDAEYIVFCGVHFMAEVAAILAKPGQRVLIPDIEAGCFLAETASEHLVEEAWSILDAALAAAGSSADAEITPITYVNSDAELKAFCGQHNGTVCTSGNADRVLKWALSQRPRVFFFPDQHLGRNTAHRLGITDDAMLLWNVRRPPSAEAIHAAKVILWPGVCNVHQRFRPEHVHAMRARYPGIRIIVHPECKAELVALADDAGSTAYILKQVEAAPAGTQWAIGTESRLVHRLQAEHPDQLILSLSDIPPFCANMSQITLANLAEVLDALLHGELLSEVTVEPETREWAKVAVERMLAL